MAWRVTADPVVSRAMDRGPPTDRRASSASRVRSPNAAKTGAARARPVGLVLRRDMSLDVLDLGRPPLVVHAEGLGAARQRDAVETGLDYGQLGAASHFLEHEFDQRRRLGGVVDRWIDGVGVPAVRQQALGLDPFDGDLQGQVVIARAGDAAAHARTRSEGAFELHAEPAAELGSVTDRAPHS